MNNKQADHYNAITYNMIASSTSLLTLHSIGWVRQGIVAAVVGSLTSAVPMVAIAQEQFDNTVVRFNVDTIVEFEFLESNNAYQSTFGVIDLSTGERFPLIEEVIPSDMTQPLNVPSDYEDDTGFSTSDDFPGTPGNAVPNPFAEFMFEANTPYAFYLESSFNGRPAGIVYSTNAENPNLEQQASFENNIEALAAGGVIIRLDDTGSLLVSASQQDRDLDDFVVRAGGYLDCQFDTSF
jgi:hypothetical protein